MEGKKEVLLLFDKEDRTRFRELKQHLTPLENQGLITIWDEEQIIGGSNRSKVINSHIQSASLILLLLSARFMASDELYTLAKQTITTHVPPEKYVIPVLLHEVDWEHSDFGQLAAFPTNRIPISSWENQHAAYLDVVRGVRVIIEGYQSSKRTEQSQSLSPALQMQDKKEAMSDVIQDRGTTFDVFLCHNNKDKEQVKKVARQLQTQGIRPWLDEWELPPGRLWQPLVEEQIKKIRSAAVFVSKNDMGPWHRHETYALLNQFIRRGCPVIPVLLDSAPEEPDLPLFLTGIQWVDFRRQEPDPLKQLIWGITQQKQEAQAAPALSSKTVASAVQIEPTDIMQVTIMAPDGSKYTADAPADTLVDRLLHDFLRQWSSPQPGTTRSKHFSLSTADAPPLTLDRSSTLREAGLASGANLTLVSDDLNLNEPINLTVEDKQGEHYTTTVLLNTVVGQLADAFLRAKPGVGKAVAEWVVSALQTKPLQLEASLYDQGICDDALLRIYRLATAAAEE